MAKLAIRGHETRGKEVIEILEMLGGINTAHFDGENTGLAYYIEVDKSICCIDIKTEYHTWFYKITIEEFIEKFPYKVGNKVTLDKFPCTITGMLWDCDDVVYYVQGIDFSKAVSSKDRDLQPYKEETIKTIPPYMDYDIKADKGEEGVYSYNEINCYHQDFADKVQIRLGNEYEIKVEEGRTYIVKKKPKYPKTYEECCKIIQSVPNFYIDTHLYSYELDSLYKLLIHRDAYWKIAGEEMGLDGPWKYDISKGEFSSAISYQYGYIRKRETRYKNTILAFPTAEMRDAFYENFKDLIEECKEFL